MSEEREQIKLSALVRIEAETKAQTIILTHTCREVKAIRKEFASHVEEDRKLAERTAKLETNHIWIVRVLIGMVAAIGTLFGIKA